MLLNCGKFREVASVCLLVMMRLRCTVSGSLGSEAMFTVSIKYDRVAVGETQRIGGIRSNPKLRLVVL